MAYWSPKDYTPFFLFDEPTHSPKEIRAEYTRLRDIAMKRMKRFEKAGLQAQADYLREMLPKLSELPRIQEEAHQQQKRYPKTKIPEVADLLARGKAILEDASGSLKRVREIQKMIFSETGEIVPIGKVLEFNDYMKSWRLSAFSKLMVPSQDAADLYKTEDYQEIGGSFSEFYSLFLEESR